MGIPFPSRVQISLCMDGCVRPSAVLPPVASRCGGMFVAVLVGHLGGIWSDRAIGKAAGSLPVCEYHCTWLAAYVISS